MLRTRLITAAIAIPLLAWTIFWAPLWVYNLVVLFFTFVALREFAAMALEGQQELEAFAPLDARVRRGELNLLERELAATLLRGAPLKPSDTIVCDGARLFAPLAEQFSNLQAMDKAESKSTSVAAASILAKDLRDAAFEEIAQRYRESYGELRGGGYPNAATRAFLDWHLAEFGALPPETRTSWGQRTRPSSTTR